MSTLTDSLHNLVIANRILSHEGVVDAFGHVSIRHPDNPERYLLSHSRAPELITEDDLIEFTLDGDAADLRDRTPYGERMIHGAAYEMRADVHAVIHNHSYELIPFSATGVPIQPMTHTYGVIGADINTWDIRGKFGETDHLVRTMEQGRDLAQCLGDRAVTLMKRHGSLVVGRNLREAVMTAIYLQVNARIQIQAMQMGTPDFLTPGEVDKCTTTLFSPLGLDRAWEYWRTRAGYGG